jgi:hypothetical protein
MDTSKLLGLDNYDGVLIPPWDVESGIPSTTRDIVTREYQKFRESCVKQYACVKNVYMVDITKVYRVAKSLIYGLYPSLADAFEFSTRVEELRDLFTIYDAERTVGTH